jgi:hypothetical protein
MLGLIIAIMLRMEIDWFSNYKISLTAALKRNSTFSCRRAAVMMSLKTMPTCVETDTQYGCEIIRIIIHQEVIW